jgi:serine/threonine protein kinase
MGHQQDDDLATSTNNNVRVQGRPRRESRNDLFSMDWKWRGQATGTEVDSSLSVKREEVGQVGGSGDRSGSGLFGLGIQAVAGTGADDRVGAQSLAAPSSSLLPSPNLVTPRATCATPAKSIRTAVLDSPSPPLSSLPSTPAPIRSGPAQIDSSLASNFDLNLDLNLDTNPEIELKVDLLSRRTKLGSGRYSNVHLGRFRSALNDDDTNDSRNDEQNSDNDQSKASFSLSEDMPDEQDGLNRTGWNICAIKVFNGDEEGWTMARKENEVGARLCREDGSNSIKTLGAGEAEEGRVLRRFGLVREDQVGQEEDLEQTLRKAGLLTGLHSRTGSGSGSMVGSPRPNVSLNQSRDAIIKGMDALGRGLPSRLILKEEEKRSVSDSKLVQRKTTPAQGIRARGRKSLGGDLPRPMLILEYLPGGTVESFVKRTPDKVDAALWRKWMKQGLQALDRMHRNGIVHCDLKPANLLLDDNLNLVVADFSSSVIIADENDPPTDGIGRGTPPYSSPEMVDPCPTRSFGYASDVFSFGATMYSLITGCEPFRGVRSIELMWNVRKGRFWEWEERARLMRVERVGLPVTPTRTTPGSASTTMTRTAFAVTSPPSTSMSIGHGYRPSTNVKSNFHTNNDGVRRAGSLRESVLSEHRSFDRPKLPRMSSSELLIVTPDTSPTSISHPYVISNTGVGVDGRDARDPARDLFSLASRVQTQGLDDTADKKEKAKTLRIDTRLSNSVAPSALTPSLSSSSVAMTMPIEPYSDGTPAMVHLNGLDRVDEVVWRMLKRMVDPVPENRGPAREHLEKMFGTTVL